MFRRTPRFLALCALTFVLPACDDMDGDPGGSGDPADPVVVSVEGDLAPHVGLLWMSALFQQPGAAGQHLGDVAVGTVVDVANGTIDLGGVEPPIGIYSRACAAFAEDCDAEMQALEAADAFSLARLVTTGVDGLDCTYADPAACTFDDHVHAPGHLVLFVRAAFDPASDPFLRPAAAAGMVEPGVYLVQWVSKQQMTIVPYDADTVQFVAGGDPVNFF